MPGTGQAAPAARGNSSALSTTQDATDSRPRCPEGSLGAQKLFLCLWRQLRCQGNLSSTLTTNSHSDPPPHPLSTRSLSFTRRYFLRLRHRTGALWGSGSSEKSRTDVSPAHWSLQSSEGGGRKGPDG